MENAETLEYGFLNEEFEIRLKKAQNLISLNAFNPKYESHGKS